MKVVVFVDVQKDFIDGTLRNEKAIEVTPKIVEFAKECVKNGYKLYATRDTHENTVYGIEQPTGKILEVTKKSGFTADENEKILRGYLATLEGKKLPVEHCVEGTDGWMIDNHLMEVLDGNCTFINKSTFGSFDLAEIIAEDDLRQTNTHNYLAGGNHNLRKSVLEEIIVCGFNTLECVLANAVILKNKFPKTSIIVIKDLCSDISRERHELALRAMNAQKIEVI